MHWGISPSFVEEPTSSIQMRKVVFVGLTSPEIHIGYFKITPEVAGRIPVSLDVVFRPSLAVCQPFSGIVLDLIFWMCRQEFKCLRPKGGDGLRRIVKVDGEPICLVMVVHIAEDIVVDITEKMDLGLNTPVVTDVSQGRVVVE